jgi:hypothetical protein
MLANQKLEKDSQTKMQEIRRNMKKLDADFHQLLAELGLTSEQVHDFSEQMDAFIENPDHFSSPIWEKLLEEKKSLDEQVAINLANITDPIKTQKSFFEQGSIKPHWIFVR